MSHMELDSFIARLQGIPSFNINLISNDGNGTVPWYEAGPEVFRDLVVDELTIPDQVAKVAVEIQKWGRLSALARRVWQIHERGYRAWRSAFVLTETDPDGKPSGWKKPTKEQIEAMYRVDPKYHDWQVMIERAEEAYNAAEAMVQAFRAKKDVLIRYAGTWHEAGAATATTAPPPLPPGR